MQSTRPEGSILNSLRRVVRFLRVSSRAAERDWGLSGAQLFVLQTLGSEARPLSINEMAARAHTHQSSVSTVVARLVERELVSRAPGTTDRRRVEISLTRQGRSLLGKTPETAQERLLFGIGKLSTKDQARLGDLLEKIILNSGLSQEPADLFFEDHP